MNEWLEKFYNDPALRETLLRSFLPVFSNYVSEATGGPVAAAFVQSLAESYVDRHLGSSRAQLQDLVSGSSDPLKDLAKRFEEWEEKRPEKVAKNELIRSANAAQVQAFRDAGVEKMVWAASGGACPFCQELDGVIISVNGTFFEPGDTLNPEGVEHPIHFESTIGHPPVHQGCTCSVEAVTETQQTFAEMKQLLPEVPDADLEVIREFGVKVEVFDVDTFYDPKTKTIHLEGGTVNTPGATHEAGHALDHALGWPSQTDAFAAIAKADAPKGYGNAEAWATAYQVVFDGRETPLWWKDGSNLEMVVRNFRTTTQEQGLRVRPIRDRFH